MGRQSIERNKRRALGRALKSYPAHAEVLRLQQQLRMLRPSAVRIWILLIETVALGLVLSREAWRHFHP